MNHDKAIEAAARTGAGDIWDHYHEMMITESRAEFIEERWKLSVPSVKKIISAFLRDVAEQINTSRIRERVDPDALADELEGR